MVQVFQRQMSKEGLQAVVNGNDAAGGGWSSEMLRDLFTLRQDTASDTYDSRCRTEDDDSMEAEEGTKQDWAPPEHKLQVGHQCHGDSWSCPRTGSSRLLRLVMPTLTLHLTQLLDWRLSSPAHSSQPTAACEGQDVSECSLQLMSLIHTCQNNEIIITTATACH